MLVRLSRPGPPAPSCTEALLHRKPCLGAPPAAFWRRLGGRGWGGGGGPMDGPGRRGSGELLAVPAGAGQRRRAILQEAGPVRWEMHVGGEGVWGGPSRHQHPLWIPELDRPFHVSLFGHNLITTCGGGLRVRPRALCIFARLGSSRNAPNVLR